MFTEEQRKLHKRIAHAKNWRFRKRVTEAAKRHEGAKELMKKIREGLPTSLVDGVIMVNAETEEWFYAASKDAGWQKARKKYGPDIACWPMYMIDLDPKTQTSRLPPP